MASKLNLIAISGGIGSGKSMIRRMLAAMGYAVYDCDSHAKKLMDQSEYIIGCIAKDICPDAVITADNGICEINRSVLANAVFHDARLMEKLNNLVHGAVKSDIVRWKDALAKGMYAKDVAFVETAILFQSGVFKLVDAIWEIDAPADVRLRRAMQRDNATAEQISARIKAQSAEHKCKLMAKTGIPCHTITNDGRQPVLPQVLLLLKNLQ